MPLPYNDIDGHPVVYGVWDFKRNMLTNPYKNRMIYVTRGPATRRANENPLALRVQEYVLLPVEEYMEMKCKSN